MPEQPKPQPTMYDMFSGMLKDHLGRAEFIDAFKNVVAQIQKLKLSNEQDVAAMRLHIQQLTDKLNSESTTELATAKQAALDYCIEMMQTHEQKMLDMQARIDAQDEKVDLVEDGKDADTEVVINEVITRLSQKENRAPITDGPEEIRNKLELLQGDERLDKSAIRGLEEELNAIRVLSSSGKGGGMSQIGLQMMLSKLIKHQVFSTSSTTTTSTLSNKVAGDVCIWLRYNGAMLRYGTDYSIVGTTITYLFTLDDSSSVEATYITG